jgi:hypothetical protein
VATLYDLDFVTFARRAQNAPAGDPRLTAKVGFNLIEGALRIRRGEGVTVDPNDVLGSYLNRKPVRPWVRG